MGVTDLEGRTRRADGWKSRKNTVGFYGKCSKQGFLIPEEGLYGRGIVPGETFANMVCVRTSGRAAPSGGQACARVEGCAAPSGARARQRGCRNGSLVYLRRVQSRIFDILAAGAQAGHIYAHEWVLPATWRNVGAERPGIFLDSKFF